MVSHANPKLLHDLDPKIRAHKWCPRPGGTVLLCRLNFSTTPFVDLAKSGISSSREINMSLTEEQAEDQVIGSSHSIWVPSAILALAIPEVLKEYIQQNGEPEQKSQPIPVRYGQLCYSLSHAS